VSGRRFAYETTVALADAAPSGRARFDALARWLQDAAYRDVVAAGFEDRGAWVVRRCRLELARAPVFGEALTLTTWCSGLGRMWAERRTTIDGDGGAAVEAVALWVHLDPASGRPRPLDDDQVAVWASSAGDRRVKARLRHPDPPAGAASGPWRFRRADLDIADHVNNAMYWTVLEEDLDPAAALPRSAEIEYRGAALAGEALVRRDGGRWWVCAPDGTVHASIAAPAPPDGAGASGRRGSR
jgi:acyl-ACP thioesterase